MKIRDEAARSWRVLALAAGLALAGCGGDGSGTIPADRQATTEALNRQIADRPAPAGGVAPGGNRLDDRSPKLRDGGP